MSRLVLFCAALLAAALWWAGTPDAMPVKELEALLFWHGHLPRGAVALLAGALLGLSGALLQAVLRNPLADPSTLGISAGAQLALVLVLLFAPGVLIWGRWPVAMAGAGLATALVMGIGAARSFHPVTMVVAGMLVALFTASLSAALTLSQGQYLYTLVVWNGGSLVQTGWTPALALTGVLAIGSVGAKLMARALGVLGLEAESARALGLPVAQLRALAVVLAAILAGAVSAAVGLVAFVGLAAPALARAAGARTVGQTLALAPLTGALLLSVCDGLVMMVAGAGGEMFPTGAITGLIGGPLLLWLLPRLRATPPPATSEHLPRLPRPAPRLLVLAASSVALAVLFLWIGRLPGGWTLLDLDSLRAFLPNRLPRLAGAAAAGGLLALAGAVLQRLTANPLASPEVLGVSGGAAMGYAAVLFALAAPSATALSLGAAGGGILALMLVTGMVLGRHAPPERLLLAGVAVSALAAAVLSVLMAAGTGKSFAVLAWLSGSASTLTAPGAWALAALLILTTGAALLSARWLTLLSLGPEVPAALGLPRARTTAILVGIAGLATGAATTLVGPLSFVGLMAPHLARRMGFARTADHLLGAVLIGALLMLAADFGARMAAFPYDLPLGLFASLLGAPWLIRLLLRRPL